MSTVATMVFSTALSHFHHQGIWPKFYLGLLSLKITYEIFDARTYVALS